MPTFEALKRGEQVFLSFYTSLPNEKRAEMTWIRNLIKPGIKLFYRGTEVDPLLGFVPNLDFANSLKEVTE